MSLSVKLEVFEGPLDLLLHLIEKNGFTRCGIIIVDDGTERIAFQKAVE